MTRREPLDWFRREFGSFFDRALPSVFEVPVEFRWGLETMEAENEYVVRAEMPGFEVGEIEVNLANNLLTIRAAHMAAEAKAAEGNAPEAKEAGNNRPETRLERVVTVPEGINPEGITANYRNGMLEVHLPKTPETAARKIEVSA
jgi:HSP20 family protein